MSEEIVSDGSAAQICTCGDDLARNGGRIHNYVCPYTEKCPHLIPRINIYTGQTEQRPCGSRLEPEYASHGIGCPCLSLCPHCGTRMDGIGIHNFDCPNNRYQRAHLYHIDPDFHNIVRRLENLYEDFSMSIKPLPSIVDGKFDVPNDCSICLLSFSQSQQVMKPSECTHCFHENCMMSWVQADCKNNRKCPNCRVEIETILKQELK
jgi:hypothetical protein